MWLIFCRLVVWFRVHRGQKQGLTQQNWQGCLPISRVTNWLYRSCYSVCLFFFPKFFYKSYCLFTVLCRPLMLQFGQVILFPLRDKHSLYHSRFLQTLFAARNCCPREFLHDAEAPCDKQSGTLETHGGLLPCRSGFSTFTLCRSIRSKQ